MRPVLRQQRGHLQVRQTHDEVSHPPARDRRPVQAQLLQLLQAAQGGESGVCHLSVAKRQLLQPAQSSKR